jgi:hypothetical protein
VTIRLSQVQSATAEALPEIAALLGRVFPRRRPWAPDLEWQYVRNPDGPARFVNAYTEAGALIAHYALVPTPPLADPPVPLLATYFVINTAVDASAQVPGLMVATARNLFRQMQAEGPVLMLGVGNENSSLGLVRMLGFRSLGRLSLTFHAPGTLPRIQAPRALACDSRRLLWRSRRPFVSAYADPAEGALSVRLRHRGVPLDALLTTGLPPEVVAKLGLPRAAFWAPRLYATFGTEVCGGLAVPDWLRPSPLEYVFRVLGDPTLTEPVARHLAQRRFEFLDFDVV